MKSVLLHGGDLVAYEAINSNGHPVWESASAFLDSLARTPSLGERYSRFLAVPRVCSGGSRIEWYIPDFSPQDPSGDYRIIAWDAATPEERQQAYEKLMDLDKALYAYGNMLLSRGVDGDNLTFAQF
nr:hypothetical protein [Succinivibrionaceae bacterium]